MTRSRVRRVLAEEFGALHPRRTIALGAARWLPPLALFRVRTALIRSAGVSVGRGTLFGGALRVVGSGGSVSFGRGCWINAGCHIDASADVTIGDGVRLGHDVLIVTDTHQVGPPEQRAGPRFSLAVTIQAGAWVGSRAVLLPGVRIGPGAVVAAGAVVNRDVAADTVVGGVPAKPLRTLPTGAGD